MADLFAGAVVRVHGRNSVSPELCDQIACVAREVALLGRNKVSPMRNVYRGVVPRGTPDFVASGRMTPEKAEHELACMEAVLATLRELEMGAADEPQGGVW